MIWDENLSIEDSYEFALKWITDAFIIHQTSVHRHPVYRHRYGDIPLTYVGLSGLLDGYLEYAGKSISQRGRFYVDLIDWEKWEALKSEAQGTHQPGVLYSMGAIPPLTREGMAWITCQLDQFGDMVQEFGSEEAIKLLALESDDEKSN